MYDPRTYMEHHLTEIASARLRAVERKEKYTQAVELQDLEIERLDTEREACQEWMENHPS